jgi:hypothetical protein
MPLPLTLSSESVSSTGLYLLDDGRYMYLYIGSDLPMPFLEEVFLIRGDGKSVAGQYRIRHVPNQPAHVSSRINVLIGALRKNKPNFQNLQVISSRPPANVTHTPAQNGGGHGPTPSPTNRSGWETFESLDASLFFSHLIEDAVIKPTDQNGSSSSGKKEKTPLRTPNTMSYIDFRPSSHHPHRSHTDLCDNQSHQVVATCCLFDCCVFSVLHPQAHPGEVLSVRAAARAVNSTMCR